MKGLDSADSQVGLQLGCQGNKAFEKEQIPSSAIPLGGTSFSGFKGRAVPPRNQM